MSPRGRRGVLAAAVVALASSVLLFGGAAIGAMTALPGSGVPGVLDLSWGPTPQNVTDLEPGDVVHWQLAAHLSDRSEGSFSLQLRAQGDLATMSGGLELTLLRCDEDFAGFPDAPTCASGPLVVLGPAEVASIATSLSSDTWALPPLRAGQSQFFLATVTIPADVPAPAPGTTLEGAVGFGFTVLGADADPPSPGLAATGANIGAGILAAVGLLLLGVAALLGSRRTRRGRS